LAALNKLENKKVRKGSPIKSAAVNVELPTYDEQV